MDGVSEYRMDLGLLMNLIEAAESAELKLRTEYQSTVADEDLSHPYESWAEGEALREALDAMRFDILRNSLMARWKRSGDVIYLDCPNCHMDIPDDDDLARFVRFYGGDFGWRTCPHCGTGVTWEMQINRQEET